MKRAVKRAPKRPKAVAERLPKSSPAELLRMLIPASQAFDLTITGTAGDALANATQRIGQIKQDGLAHLVCTDILDALAELVLRAKQLSPEMLGNVHSCREAVEAAKRALAAAEQAHARAKAEVFAALGYKEQAEALGFRVGVVEAS